VDRKQPAVAKRWLQHRAGHLTPSTYIYTTEERLVTTGLEPGRVPGRVTSVTRVTSSCGHREAKATWMCSCPGYSLSSTPSTVVLWQRV